MKRYLFRILITLSMLIHSIPGRVHLGTIHMFDRDRSWYYILTAFAWPFAAMSIPFFDRMYINDWIFFRIFMWLTFNECARELFWDPTHTGWHDVYFAIFVILTEVFHKFIAHILNKLFYGITGRDFFK